MAIDDDLVYELNESGERVVVKSIESVSKAHLRFTNRTTRPVEVAWRNFEGEKCIYTCLEPGTSYDITTYLTHPWEFTDRETKENYTINNKPIFRAPVSLGEKTYRTNWNITTGMRTLRHSALLVVALIIPSMDKIYELELPRSLEDDLSLLITELKSFPRGNE